MMRDIVWMLRSDNDTLGELVVKMREVAGRLLAGVGHSFNGPTDGASTRLRPETKRNLFLFYKEALNNVVRHSGAKVVDIRLETSDDSIELRIADNGHGFERFRSGSGSGLGNLDSRAREMRASMTIRPNPGSGTIIVLRIPAT
jgi:signal transduction histidine kinase